VPHVQGPIRLAQPFPAGAVNLEAAVVRTLHGDAHRAHCGNGGEYVLALQQAGRHGGALGNRAEHHGAVTDGLVPGNGKFSCQARAGLAYKIDGAGFVHDPVLRRWSTTRSRASRAWRNNDSSSAPRPSSTMAL